MKLKVGEKVIVIAGANKGKIGKLNRILSKENRVIVEGVNLVKRHKKPDGKDQTGGIVEFEAPIHISNVMLVDSKTGKGSRKATREKIEKPKKEKEPIKKEETKEKPKKETPKKEKIEKPKKETKVSKTTNKKNDK